LSNKLSKDVEFNTNATDRKVVFEGTYTAKKGDIKLNEFSVTGAYAGTTNKITFYVLVDGKEVADDKYDPATTTASNTFDNILVKAGESVTVSVEAEVEAYTAETIDKFSFAIRGEDVNGNNPSGK
jgi:flavodoxin